MPKRKNKPNPLGVRKDREKLCGGFWLPSRVAASSADDGHGSAFSMLARTRSESTFLFCFSIFNITALLSLALMLSAASLAAEHGHVCGSFPSTGTGQQPVGI